VLPGRDRVECKGGVGMRWCRDRHGIDTATRAVLDVARP
jgi:hypothetical protein